MYMYVYALYVNNEEKELIEAIRYGDIFSFLSKMCIYFTSNVPSSWANIAASAAPSWS